MIHTDAYVVGLTGPTGAGKSSVAKRLKELGAVVFDCDLLAREIVMPGKPALAELADCFGAAVLNDDGTLNRRLLADMVFTDQEKRKKLNEITHRHITELLSRRIAKAQGIAVIDAPLLFEAGLERICDCVVVVTAPKELRLLRITERDGLSQTAAEARISSQSTDALYEEKADYIIRNDGTVDDLLKKTDRIWRAICEKAKKKN